jgi:hypothetical protein
MVPLIAAWQSSGSAKATLFNKLQPIEVGAGVRQFRLAIRRGLGRQSDTCSARFES